jgi:hypothetical protein
MAIDWWKIPMAIDWWKIPTIPNPPKGGKILHDSTNSG